MRKRRTSKKPVGRQWVKIGECAVDSGHVIVGDFCHLLVDEDPIQPSRRTPSVTTRNLWDEVEKQRWRRQLRNLSGKGRGTRDTRHYLTTPVEPAKGYAVVTATGWGDGRYPVMALKDPNGRVAAMLVVFMSGRVPPIDDQQLRGPVRFITVDTPPKTSS